MIMKAVKISMLVMSLYFIAVSFCFADLNQYLGNWKNVDTNTQGITRIELTKSGGKIFVHAWGKCHPEDCDWGAVEAFAYAQSVSESMINNTRVVTAVYSTNFSQTVLVVRLMSGNRLQVEVFTRFTDNSNRNNYTKKYTFSKKR
jgi:hypothetical protein